ncbi:penicillin-binding protein activator [Spirochaeta africana]|uniref:ABC-type branched-chain amino acid transport system, periplasmic component n=1 Tax=Spirochaeta africana (strain ATCC 700263 / DSM 8902 / Z-7692) TaxID=889378 RepID=H9ULV6_SPIAZ|nr:penicillin-binding protein activator [Spirochaeta africana]AFG38499.1 ABC-type branched-chain amino acid transport system, periplasmic component [Spirochaeta africana DSM 8902]
MSARNPGGLLSAAVLLLLLAGCAPQTHTIGFIGSLTGVRADLAVAVRDGVQLGTDHINQADRGYRLQLQILDDGYSATAAAALATELAAAGRADIIIGFLTSGMLQAALHTAGQHPGIPVISPTISGRVPDHQVLFFQLIGAARQQGQQLAEQAFADGVRSAAVVRDSGNLMYTAEVAQGFSERFAQLGGHTVLVLSQGEFDFSASRRLVKYLQESDHDALVAALSGVDLGVLAQELRLQHGDERPVYAGMWAFTPELLTQGGRAAEGIILSSAVDPDYPGDAYREFQAAFRERYNTEPAFGAVLGYEAVLLVDQLLHRSTRIGRDVPETIEFSGLQGRIRWEPGGEVQRDYFLFRVSEGRFARL